MPRGVKGSGKSLKTADQKIIDIDKDIETHKKAIADLMMTKKSLIKEKNKEDKEEVKRVAARSGLTADELRALIEKHKN